MKIEENNQELMIRFLTGSLGRKEESEFIAWLGTDEKNRKTFDEFRTIWITGKKQCNPDGFDPAKAYDRFLGKINKKPGLEHQGSGNIRIFRTIYRVAAIIAIIYSLGHITDIFIKNSSKPENIAYQEIRVPLGSKSTIILPDKTRVTLNAGSVLKYDIGFGKKSREIELTGEGYFDVAQDMQKIFIVKTGHINIKALGTEFNVKSYPEDKSIETTLVSGLLQVEKIDQESNKPLKDGSVILQPKQRLTFYKDTEDITVGKTQKETVLQETEKMEIAKKTVPEKHILVEKNVDIVPDVSWKDARWVIYREELAQLAVKLERRYDISIVFQDDDLKSFRFTGTLANESIEQVLRAMSLTAPIDFEVDGNTVIFKENIEFKKKYRDLY